MWSTFITNSTYKLIAIIQTHHLVIVTFLNPSIVHTCIKILFVARAWAKIPILLQGQEFRPLYRRPKLAQAATWTYRFQFFQRKAFSECFCHDSNNDSGNVFRLQGKIHDYFDTSKVYFTMPNIINQHNELRTRTFDFAVSVSSECFINEEHKKQMPNWSTIYLPLVIFQNI
jgi:hypothetical protein